MPDGVPKYEQSHNQHTHTGNTRQPELNSRVPRVHPPSRAQVEGCHSELNSRNVTCLTPISSSTQGIRSELNSRNTNNLLPYLSATTDRARAGNHCYGSYTVMSGGVPKYEHSSQRPKTTKLISQLLRRAIYLDPFVLATTSTLTPATLANPSHNSGVPRVHPPFRATTRGMSFQTTTQGMSQSNNFSYSSKIAKRGTHTARRCSPPDRLAGDAYRQEPSASEPSITTATAWRDNPHHQAHAPNRPLILQLSPGGTSFTAKRLASYRAP
ncbi:hypothetical protein DEO72_LG6g1596 [Vigna unguiculata]|uniref:Uncharacterized protein n=1 Tax=Vigna unguiculata TaxID=3917 RepID=A0A4D6M9V5_VIGUN|nr:hypothetical protein DEO72_LG6g1596 [Vigna unguiculata]